MPTYSNNFALETKKREESDDVVDAGGGGKTRGARGHIKKFLQHEWTSDLASAGRV